MTRRYAQLKFTLALRRRAAISPTKPMLASAAVAGSGTVTPSFTSWTLNVAHLPRTDDPVKKKVRQEKTSVRLSGRVDFSPGRAAAKAEGRRIQDGSRDQPTHAAVQWVRIEHAVTERVRIASDPTSTTTQRTETYSSGWNYVDLDRIKYSCFRNEIQRVIISLGIHPRFQPRSVSIESRSECSGRKGARKKLPHVLTPNPAILTRAEQGNHTIKHQ